MNDIRKRLEFLKPTRGRVLLFAVLLCAFVLSVFVMPGPMCGAGLYGLPLAFHPSGTPFLGEVSGPSFSMVKFVLNGIFWYVISSALVSVRESQSRSAFAWLALIFGTAVLLVYYSFGPRMGLWLSTEVPALIVFSTALVIGLHRGAVQPSNHSVERPAA